MPHPAPLRSALSAPFPYYGGKSDVADVVWRAFGGVSNYVEPFAGSLAVLLGRPHSPHIETVNDLDGFVANFWRSIARAPDEVAECADQPVNECDLHAKHAWLVRQRGELSVRLMGDPEYFDAKIAGWWVWGISCWIGSEWCSGKGPWAQVDGRLVRVAEIENQGVTMKRPSVAGDNPGRGVHVERVGKKIPNVGAKGGKGVHGITRTRPHLGSAGMGVHGVGVAKKLPLIDARPGHGVHAAGIKRQLPQVTGSANGNGVHQKLAGESNGRGAAGRFEDLKDWMRALADRLRRVRVTCGDWSRVTGPSVILGNGISGVFLDPPYPKVGDDLYSQDGEGVAEQVHAWAVKNGDNDRVRIAVCGYAGDFAWPEGWREYAWKARGGYGTQENAAKERIWFSPHCVDFESQLDLFGGAR